MRKSPQYRNFILFASAKTFATGKSSKRANVHNRWWSEHSERNQRIQNTRLSIVLEEGELFVVPLTNGK